MGFYRIYQQCVLVIAIQSGEDLVLHDLEPGGLDFPLDIVGFSKIAQGHPFYDDATRDRVIIRQAFGVIKFPAHGKDMQGPSRLQYLIRIMQKRRAIGPNNTV